MLRSLTPALVLLTSAAQAYDFKRDSTGSEVKWQRTLVLVADRGLAARLKAAGAREALDAGVNALQVAATGLTVTLTEGQGGVMGFDFSGKANRNDVVALEDWTFDDDAVAVTVVTVDTRTHEIIDADIAFNLKGAAFEVADQQEKPGDHYDVQNTFTHELGHAVGLAHSKELEAVMYGETYPHETRKRDFFTDDTQALTRLYPVQRAPPPEQGEAEPAQGCSTTPTAPMLGLVFFGLLSLARRSRGAAAALLVAMPFAAAQASDSMARADKTVKVAMVGRITRADTLPPEDGVTVLKTQLEVQVTECAATPCPATVKVTVPGGTWGNYEQRVGGLEIPRVGEQVGVFRDTGKGSWVRLEKISSAAARDAFFKTQAERRHLSKR